MGIINDFNDTLKASINTNNNIVHTEKRQDKKLYYTEEYRNAIFRNDNYKNALEASSGEKVTIKCESSFIKLCLFFILLFFIF